MKFSFALICVLFNVQPVVSTQMSPITRVVELLQGLAKKIETDGKVEDDLYETYRCWYKSVMKEKEASNAAANDRIESLEAYIADIEAGRVEFSTERVDLEAQIKKLMGEIEEAEDMRDKEHEDFLAAKDEMEKAIAALEEAVKTIDEATFLQQDHKGSMLSLRREVSKFEMEEHAESAAQLKRAIELGNNYLSKGDASFLEKILTGEVPEYDWKKLNRKATFKMKYKARSTKILQMLKDMLQTFQDNLSDAIAKEKESKANFEKLTQSKNEQLDDAKAALTDMKAEGSASGLAKEDAQQEVDDLKKQVEDDTKFMADTQEQYETKMKEWKKRKELRTGEIAAINEAISVLDSDEARETFKSSFKSQGYLLLQKSATSKLAQKAAAILRQTGLATKDSRITALARRAALEPAMQDEIDKVIKAIDKMLQTLKDEEAEDLKSKEECEKSRMEQTKDARKFSIAIDDAEDMIRLEQGKIAEWKAQIAEKEAEIKQNEKDLDEATKAREDENSEYKKAKAEDEAAVGLIEKAMETLKSFYEENFSLLQNQGGAKKATPPPPPTPEGDYGGAQGESKGIQAILQMILDDVKDDIAKADKAEEDAVKAFEALKADIEEAIKDANEAISDFNDKIADSEETITEETTTKKDNKKSLDSVIKEIQSQEPGCNYMAINFGIRVKNRQLEIDGLLKAKTILEGGSFS